MSIKFVNDMVKLKRETGSLSAKRQGNPGFGKLTPYADWIRSKVEEKGEITLDELVALLANEKQMTVHRSSVGRLLHRLGLTHKKRSASA
ncbi:transposase [Roseibium sp. TrichSKD4]|uniref:winged helix-turn-helix domain-containing protein n=1 Tax=Roseibium sp. TrichSKD4 TaxID=744980 RepID=UPI0001E56597|nr:transposase [Roseibium sp. TrichSKD4]